MTYANPLLLALEILSELSLHPETIFRIQFSHVFHEILFRRENGFEIHPCVFREPCPVQIFNFVESDISITPTAGRHPEALNPVPDGNQDNERTFFGFRFVDETEYHAPYAVALFFLSHRNRTRLEVRSVRQHQRVPDPCGIRHICR